MIPVKRIGIAAIALLALGVALGAFGAQHASAVNREVRVDDNWFGQPTGSNGVTITTNLTVGDTMTWVWNGGAGDHNVRGTDSTFATNTANGPFVTNAPNLTGGQTYGPLTFSAAGTYYYRCSLHPADMRGIVVVSAPAPDTTPPTVSGVAASPNPTNGAGSVSLTATVTDNIGVAAASYTLDGGAPVAMNVSGTSASANVPTAGLSIGTHSIVVSARDAANNSGSAPAYTLNVSPVPAGAVTASVTITAGNLANTAQPVNFGSVALTGANQEKAGTTTAWNATDARGSGAGWNVTISSSNFSSSGGSISVANFRVALAQAAIVTVSGNTQPSTQVPTAVAIPLTGGGVPLKLLSAAAGAGMGSYNYTPDFALTVPAAAAPGAYTANMTVSVNSGP